MTFLLANTNNLLGESVSLQGVVQSVDRDGLSSTRLRLQFDKLLFASVPIPAGARWVGGKLMFSGLAYVSPGKSVVVQGILTKRITKYYIDPASLSPGFMYRH